MLLRKLNDEGNNVKLAWSSNSSTFQTKFHLLVYEVEPINLTHFGYGGAHTWRQHLAVSKSGQRVRISKVQLKHGAVAVCESQFAVLWDPLPDPVVRDVNGTEKVCRRIATNGPQKRIDTSLLK